MRFAANIPNQMKYNKKIQIKISARDDTTPEDVQRMWREFFDHILSPGKENNPPQEVKPKSV